MCVLIARTEKTIFQAAQNSSIVRNINFLLRTYQTKKRVQNPLSYYNFLHSVKYIVTKLLLCHYCNKFKLTGAFQHREKYQTFEKAHSFFYQFGFVKRTMLVVMTPLAWCQPARVCSTTLASSLKLE